MSIQNHQTLAMRVVVGVGGSIAAYKALDLVRRLRQAHCQVQVVMTSAAERFVTPMAFQALSGRLTRTSLWDAQAEQGLGHIAIARWATDIIIAPATADLISRLAHGLCDDLLTTVCLATSSRLWLAPAMNPTMWLNKATSANVEVLERRGYRIIGPDSGWMAEDEEGPGRLVEPSLIVERLLEEAKKSDCSESRPSQNKPIDQNLKGMRCVISAGPTYEDIDPVRFIGNRSSGKMGFALAAAAAKRGAEVVLVAGPVKLPTPFGVARRINIRSAIQMRQEILAAFPADIFIGAAAVADYMPVECSGQKIKKAQDTLSLRLVRTPDILSEVAAQTGALKLVVGFAAETHDMERFARQKLEAKHLDLIIANDVASPESGFESDENAAVAYWRGGMRSFPRCPKIDLAEHLLDLIAERLNA